MPTPDFVLALREKIGTAPLPLVGVTAVVFHREKVLLGRRSDTGELTPVTGIVDPGEEPADAAVREVAEETGVVVRATRLARVGTVPRVVYANGDQADYLDLTFRCDWVSGDPGPGDGELLEARWHAFGELSELSPEMTRRIALAIAEDDPASFDGGRG